jgi:hypothetical protein
MVGVVNDIKQKASTFKQGYYVTTWLLYLVSKLTGVELGD